MSRRNQQINDLSEHDLQQSVFFTRRYAAHTVCDGTPTEALGPYCNQWYSCERAIAVHTYLPVRDGILSETGVWDRVRVCRHRHVNRLDISQG